MQAKSIKGATPEEIKSALEQCMADASLPGGQGFKPTLAIVFLSIKLNREAVSAIFTEHDIAIFGVTTNGEFIDAETE
jgi:hypothetical protein